MSFILELTLSSSSFKYDILAFNKSRGTYYSRIFDKLYYLTSIYLYVVPGMILVEMFETIMSL